MYETLSLLRCVFPARHMCHTASALTLVSLGILQPLVYAAPQEESSATSSDSVTASAPGRSLQFNLTLDSLYSDNLSHPPSGSNLLRNFDSQSDAAALSAANLDLQYTHNKFGFHLDTGYGQVYETIGSADPWRGPNRYIGQLYGSYRPIDGNDFQVDFGKFYSSVGAEVVDTLSNFNYSRSFLFVLGAPYDHSGLRTTVPVNATLTVGAQLINGWNDVKDNNSGKTVGLTSVWTKSKWNWSQTYLGGPEKPNSNQGPRQLLDEVIAFAPSTWLAGYTEALGGVERRSPIAGVQGPRDHWTGVAGAIKLTPAKKISLSPRYEFYDDATGFTSGVSQRLTEFTGTLEYRPKPFATARLEYRDDHSNEPFFENKAGAKTDHSQQTIELAAILSLRGER